MNNNLNNKSTDSKSEKTESFTSEIILLTSFLTTFVGVFALLKWLLGS